MRTGERRFGVECWYLRALRRAGRVHAAEAGRCVLGSDAVGRNGGIYKRCGERGACMQRSDALREKQPRRRGSGTSVWRPRGSGQKRDSFQRPRRTSGPPPRTPFPSFYLVNRLGGSPLDDLRGKSALGGGAGRLTGALKRITFLARGPPGLKETQGFFNGSAELRGVPVGVGARARKEERIERSATVF